MDYTYLREEYPAVISADQLYRICHISKRKTRWLLENGVIPCKDSGKLTRRFQIRQDAPDMLTAAQAAKLTGYGTTSINQWMQSGKVKAIHYYGKNLFSKESLAAWLASPAGHGIHTKSELHRKAMEEVSETQNSAMEFGSMTL